MTTVSQEILLHRKICHLQEKGYFAADGASNLWQQAMEMLTENITFYLTIIS